ncbi:uncharacterized protein LOC135373916 [Ornithodoros turicata]|uniref:uncharacterized protein LOC135373916 n=1 Tax=Ornithodoros turicata TaxID=34597 RepID=UPI003139E7DE
MKWCLAYCLAICGFVIHQISTADEADPSLSTEEDGDDYVDVGLENCTKLSPVLSTTNQTYQCSHLCSEGGYANEMDGTPCMEERCAEGGGKAHSKQEGGCGNETVFLNGTCSNGTCIL